MTLNDAGLPLPGRELDAWCCEHILGWKWASFMQHAYLLPPYMWESGVVSGTWWKSGVHGEIDYENASMPDTLGYGRMPHVSTTHAFFQVMEAMEEQRCIWDNWEKGTEIGRQLHVPVDDDPLLMRIVAVIVQSDDYPDREHAYAHAVCACVYKSKEETGE